MSIRHVLLTAAGVVVAFLLGALSVFENGLSSPESGPRAKDQAVFAQWEVGSDSLAWERENLYDAYQQFARIGDGMTVGTHSQVPPISRTSPKPIKVLVIGDSYVWGHGYDDPDALWWRHLEQQLNARSAPGTFTVVGHGYNGMSTMSQNEWLTTSRISAIAPDVVILAIASNDTVADGTEQSLCPEEMKKCNGQSVFITPQYRECIDGKRGLVGNATRQLLRPWFPNTASYILVRYCDPKRIAAELDLAKEFDAYVHPTESIFMPDWLLAVEDMKQKLGDIPVYSFGIGWHGTGLPAELEKIDSLMAERGYLTIETPGVDQFVERSTELDLNINPVDNHISQLYGVSYARDIAKRLLYDISPDRVTAAAGTFPEQPLVSFTTPADMDLVSEPRSAQIKYNPKEDRYPFSLRASGEKLPPQAAGCVRIGEPYARIAFDRYLSQGERVTLRSNGSAPLRVRTYGYDDKYLLVYSDPVTVRPGGTFVLNASPRERGVLVSGVGKRGCGLNDTLSAPPLDLSITRD